MSDHVAVLLGLGERDPALLDAVVAWHSRRPVSRLYVVHVKTVSQPIPGLGKTVSGPPPAPLLERAEAARVRLPGVDVEAVYAVGRAPEELARLAETRGLDLVVLGRAPAERQKAAWGAQGLRILRTSDCPVLVVPNGARLELGRAFVGMDFSPNAVDALRITATLCTEVRALAVVDPAEEAEAAEATARRYYAATVAPAFDGSPPPLDVVQATGPADALLAAANQADLLAIGSRGLTPIAAVLLGSTAERLGGRCRQPLLVVRRRGENRGLFGGLLRS